MSGMSDSGVTKRNAQDWEKTYREAKPGDLPWDRGGPDPELVELVDGEKIKAGRSIDLGTGPAHEAIFLRSRGFDVVAIDIAPTAIELAKANAAKASVSGIEWRVGDILKIADAGDCYDFVNDRACFHGLEPEERPAYISVMKRILRSGGNLFIRTFSDKEPPGPGPYRFSEAELKSYFTDGFAVLDFRQTVASSVNGRSMNVCLLRRK